LQTVFSEKNFLSCRNHVKFCRGLNKHFDVSGDEPSLSHRWIIWRRSFELFLRAKRIVTHAQKKGYLFVHAGDDIIEVWNTLPAVNEAPVGDENEYTQCIDA
jgi:hypothetical protein